MLRACFRHKVTLLLSENKRFQFALKVNNLRREIIHKNRMWIKARVQGFLTTEIHPVMGKRSLLFLGYQCSCSLPALCHAAEAVVMAMSSAVMDSVCDNGCNMLSVLFTTGLTCLLSPPRPSVQLTAAVTFQSHMHAHTHTHTHAHTLLNRDRQSG